LMNYTKKRAEVLRRRRQWRNALTMMKRETILVLTVEKRERGERWHTHNTHERPSVVLSTLKYPTRLREKLMKNSNQLLGHCVK
jgi:hypothetical protein